MARRAFPAAAKLGAKTRLLEQRGFVGSTAAALLVWEGVPPRELPCLTLKPALVQAGVVFREGMGL